MGNGRTYVDVTVVNAFSAAYLTASRSAGSPALAAESACDWKVAKYASLFASDSTQTQTQLTEQLVPLAATALGWQSATSTSLRWLRPLSDVCAAASSEETGVAWTSLMTSLSIALWRDNSRMMRAGRPYTPFTSIPSSSSGDSLLLVGSKS